MQILSDCKNLRHAALPHCESRERNDNFFSFFFPSYPSRSGKAVKKASATTSATWQRIGGTWSGERGQDATCAQKLSH